jgi:hypothetical protein
MVLLDTGMKILTEHLGVVDVERFIFLVTSLPVKFCPERR